MKYAFMIVALIGAPAVAQQSDDAADAPLPGFISVATSPPPPIAVSNSPNPPYPNPIVAVPRSEVEKYPQVIAVPVETPPPGVIIVPPQQSDGREMREGDTYIVPPPPPARIVQGPVPRAAAQSYIHDEDYPASALAARQQGRVAMTLEIGVDGRVSRCLLASGSGSAALDFATCRILRSRARFTPARDSNGNPAVWMIRQEVEWRLPAH